MPRSLDVLLLTNDAGSGHRSAAIAIEAAFSRLYPGSARVAVRNPVQATNASDVLRRYERVYVTRMQRAPGLYHIGYTLSELPGLSQILHQSVQQMLNRSIRQLLDERHYDVVMSVYPIYSAVVAHLNRHQSRRPALMTVVTDLGAVHNVWFNRTDDYVAVPTVVARAKAIKCGLSENQVVTTGIPVQPDFAAPRIDPLLLRKELGWHPSLPTILLLGGGAGVGQIESLALALDQVKVPLQVAVVTGTNTALAERLSAHPWRIPAHIYGFVPLADLMHAADIVSTKAGGLTVSEALAAGKPLLIHGDPPGQEEGNLRYVQSQGAGLWVEDANAMTALVTNWLTYPSQMERAAAHARRLGRPDAALRIARLGWELGTQGPPARSPEFKGRWWRSMVGS